MTTKKTDSKFVFKDFLEYWYYARILSTDQQCILFESLSDKDKEMILESCHKGCWDDVVNRNILDKEVDRIKKEYGFDLIDIRNRVRHNKSVYVPTAFWKMIKEEFSRYKARQSFFVLNGIDDEECVANKDVTLLFPMVVEQNK